MRGDEKINRRDFIKSTVAVGGMLLAQTSAAGQAMHLLYEDREANSFANGDLLKGVCDIHLHCRPDSRERSVDEYGFMRDAMAAGYRAVMFKSNDFSCHDRAYIIRQALPEAECFGSFCMNRVHGDKVNVFVARKAVETSGGLCRCIWMPTLDADYQYRCAAPYSRRQFRKSQPLDTFVANSELPCDDCGMVGGNRIGRQLGCDGDRGCGIGDDFSRWHFKRRRVV